MTDPREALATGDAVLTIDAQNDFYPGSALAIKGGDAVVPVAQPLDHRGGGTRRPCVRPAATGIPSDIQVSRRATDRGHRTVRRAVMAPASVPS
ncbi:MAG TPA: hypothetical protein VFH61_01155 [Thermoleophilia bacterium]|nr:hypothetical protein [Thermoleophilia bacterium]